MSLPDVAVTIQDGGLGIVPQNTANTHLKVGVCSVGSVGTMYSFSDPASVASVLGTGPLVEALIYALNVAGGPVYAMPVNASVAGTTGPVWQYNTGAAASKIGTVFSYQPTTGAAATSSVTHGGAGAGTVAVAGTPLGNYNVVLTVTTLGLPAVMAFTLSLDGGVTFTNPISPAGVTYAIPGTGLTLTLANAFVVGDTYSFTSVAHGAANTGTIALTGSPSVTGILRIVMTSTAAAGTATFTFSTDGGQTTNTGTLTSAGGGVALPGTGVTATFTGNFTTGDAYQATMLSGVSGNLGPGTVTISAGTPKDAYNVQVKITTAGVPGTAQFVYSLDGGATFSGAIAVPSGGTYVLNTSTLGTGVSTGLTLTFAVGLPAANTAGFAAGDVYAFTAVAPGYTTGDLSAALTAALASPLLWGFVHVVGQAATATATATVATTVDTFMTTAQTSFRYVWALVEGADDSDASQITAFASFASARTMVAAGFCGLASPLSGQVRKRSAAWPIAARCAKKPVGEDVGRVASGPLDGVRSLLRDEFATPGLDAQRFATLRTIIGRPGFYCTQGNMMAAPGSDYGLVQRRQVMDVACAAGRSALLQFLNDSLRINATTGFIDERDARNVESFVGGQLNAAVVQPGSASSATATTNRNDNLLSVPTLRVKLRVVPLGYAKSIIEDIGFTNPALLVKGN